MRKTTEENIEEQTAIFGVLSDPTRLRLLKLLCNQRDTDALCVNALAGFLGVTQSAVSQHLRVLKSIGLVKGERRGYHIHYFVNHEALERCQNLISTVLMVEKVGKEQACEDYCPTRRERNVSREYL